MSEKTPTYRTDRRAHVSVRIKPETLAYIQQVAMEDNRPYSTMIGLILDFWVKADKARKAKGASND